MSGRSRGTAGVLALVIGSAALAACGAGDGSAGAGSSSASPTSTAPTSTAPASTAPTSTAATSTAPASTVTTGSGTSTHSLPGAPPSGPLLRVTGTVQEGSKPQCRLLKAPRTSYLLLGDRQPLLVGTRVTVVGVVLDNVRTMCPGVPLGVVAVQHLVPPPPGLPTARLTGGHPAR